MFKTMNYLSVCSGIEAATVAWHPLAWNPIGFGEIEKFPCQVLAHHYPEVPNFGDMTKFKEWEIESDVNVLVGGTPCQSFSVAGLRKGLDDPRGNLMLTYLAIAAKHRPKWLVWENVPGVLSSNGGLDFASLLRGMGELGYGFAYRVLDAQYFGVAQRRRRVFVVGYLGSWQRAAAVLFERHSLCGYPAPSREKRERIADTLTVGANQCSGFQGDFVEARKSTTARMVAFGEYSDDGSASAMKARDYKDATDLVMQTMSFPWQSALDPIGKPTDLCGTLIKNQTPAVMHPTVVAPTLTASNDPSRSPQSSEITQQVYSVLQASMAVRRLTPTECERLQGFPDGYTDIRHGGKATPDGPRYKALGNSMAVPVMAWIGQRIQEVEEING